MKHRGAPLRPFSLEPPPPPFSAHHGVAFTPCSLVALAVRLCDALLRNLLFTMGTTAATTPCCYLPIDAVAARAVAG